jgi:hypothetical protein
MPTLLVPSLICKTLAATYLSKSILKLYNPTISEAAMMDVVRIDVDANSKNVPKTKANSWRFVFIG